MKLRAVMILATMVLGGVLLSGVVLAKTLTGGPGNNNYVGTNGTDYIYGGGGGDDLGGRNGADWIYGEGGSDRLHGGGGNDRVDGGLGSDTAWGDAGTDKLTAEYKYKGSSQAAKVERARKPDRLLGGRGNDTFRAKNGKRDIIRGGPGYDKAFVDRVDEVKGVEKVVRGGGGGTNPPGSGGTNPPGGGGNKPPVAKKDSYSVYEDTHLNVVDGANDVLSNDTDPDNTNADLTVKDADSTTPGIQPESDPAQGLLTLNADGSFDYNHTENCTLQSPCPPDSFTYKATDGAADSKKAAKVNITVCIYNDPNPPAGCPPP